MAVGSKGERGRRALGSLVALLLVCAPLAIASPGDPTALGCIRDDDTGEAGCASGEADGLDRRTFKPGASPFKKRMKAGRHRFEVRATDTAGNVDPTPAQARWRVLPAD